MKTTDTLECRAILFDMDGTLVDSTAVIHRAWQWWSSKHSLPLEAILAVERGRPNREVLTQFGPHLDIDKEAADFLKVEEEDIDGLVAIPGALDAVRNATQGLWGVVTSANQSLGVIRLKATGIPIPSVLVSADMIHRGKPDPECYLLAAERLGVEPRHCLVFEDAPAGVAAGKAAGMTVTGVLTNLSAAQLPADRHIRDFRDVSIAFDGSRAFAVTFTPF